MRAWQITEDLVGRSGRIEWGPPELRVLLIDQLDQHGFDSDSADACVEQIAQCVGPAAKASLFVDLGACRFLDGDVAGAIAVWRQAIASGQQAPAVRALFNLAVLHEQLQLDEVAADLFRRAGALHIEPYSSWAVIAQAHCDFRAGNVEAAARAMTRLAESLVIENPQSELLGRALLGLGDIAEASERNDQAEQAYRAAASAANAHVSRLGARELVRLLRSMGHDDEADEVATSLLPASKPESDELLAHAESLLHRGRLDEAATISDDISTDDLSVMQRFGLVRLLRGVGKPEAGLDELETLAKSPDTETRGRATYVMGEMYAGHEMHDEARAMFERSADEGARYWSEKSHIALGDLDFHQGDQRSAGMRWAEASGSSVAAIATAARERIVDALDAPVMIEATTDDGVEDSDDVAEDSDDGVEDSDGVTEDSDDGVEDSDDVAEDIADGVEDSDDITEDSDDETSDMAPIATPTPALDLDMPISDSDGGADVGGGTDSDAGDDLHSGAELAPPMPTFDASNVDLANPEPTVVSLRSPQPQLAVAAPAPERVEVATEAEASVAPGTVIDLRKLRDRAADNPYAALAPSARHDDVSPSTRNPYEELAPNYASDDADATEDLFRDWSDPNDDSFTELF